jgi:hypothetical protein
MECIEPPATCKAKVDDSKPLCIRFRNHIFGSKMVFRMMHRNESKAGIEAERGGESRFISMRIHFSTVFFEKVSVFECFTPMQMA